MAANPANEQVIECDFMGSGEVPTAARTAETGVVLSAEDLAKFSPEDQTALQKLGLVEADGTAKVQPRQLVGLLQGGKQVQKKSNGALYAVLFIIGVIVAIGINTVATFVVVETTKESNVKDSTLVSADGGKTVVTANEHMQVNSDGMLVVGKAVKARRLAAGGATDGIKTHHSLMQAPALSSCLPDSVLHGVEEIVVTSDKGDSLKVTVQGFSRIHMLNSQCGNVVHFYTAWLSRITYDGTTVSFDEITAAHFKKAGFAVSAGGAGGRRLAGNSASAAFFKHMADLKDVKTYTSTQVPLPTLSGANILKESIYHPCGSKSSATTKPSPDMCDSKYGGLVVGAGPLDQKHALASASKSARARAMLTPHATGSDLVYVKSSATKMNSAKFTVQVEKFQNHPGQERITVYDHDAKQTVFQVLATQTRSHCKTLNAHGPHKAMKDVVADPKVDTDLKFEFMDMVEEDGVALRHFRMMTADAYNIHMMGQNMSQGVAKDAFTEYWDVADTLTPYRIISGDGSITVFDSVKPSCTDAEVTAFILNRTGKSMTDVLTCAADEKTGRNLPEMTSHFVDVTEEDADHYTAQNFDSQDDMIALAQGAAESEQADLARYLAKTQNEMAMPDVCYAQCRDAVDRLRAVIQDAGDTCATGTLNSAMECMITSPSSQCTHAEFVSNHWEECGKLGNYTALSARRLVLEDEEEDEEEGQMLVNATVISEDVLPKRSRNMMSTECHSKFGRTTWMGDGWCMKWQFKRYPKFALMIKWGYISGAMGLQIQCEACVPILLVWAIPPPLVVEKCAGGEIQVTAVRSCPYIPITITGKVYMSVGVKADFGIVSISIAKIEIGIEAAVSTFSKEVHCWWICGEGRRRRRRWWSRRRRRTRACNYKSECDLKVGAYAEVTLTVVKGKLELDYWVRHKTLTVTIRVYAFEVWKLFFGGWKEMYSREVCRYKFR